MNEQTMETVELRLGRLERENRRLKRAGLVVLAVVAAVALMGQATPVKVRKVVEAEKFIVRDTSGRVRAELGMFPAKPPFGEEDVVVFHLSDKDGKKRVNLVSVPELSMLSFHDKENEAKISMGVGPNGWENLEFIDKAGNYRAVIQGGNSFMLVLIDKDGNVRLKADDEANLNLYETGTMKVFDKFGKDGKVIWSAP